MLKQYSPIKQKNTNIVRDYNIINNNCIIMDENLKHV